MKVKKLQPTYAYVGFKPIAPVENSAFSRNAILYVAGIIALLFAAVFLAVQF